MTQRGPILFAMTHTMPGGLREIWNDIAEGLHARGHATGRFVFYPHADEPADSPDDAEWHRLVAQRPGSPLAALRLLFALIRYLRAVRPSVVVTAMPAANVVLPLAVALARVATRVFVSHHSPTETHNRLLDRIDGWTGSLACVAGVISVSHAVAASLDHKPARYRAKRVTIPNALPERIEALVDRLRRDAPAVDAKRIVALGRLTYQKNYPMLLHALAQVPKATLDIVGTGEDEAALRALAADLGIADRVRFAGLMPRAQALALAASADLFVQVSRYEGHSLALIEAARLGLPLIVSDVAVQVEAITARDGTRCGIAVSLGDSAALAREIATLLADPAVRGEWARRALRIAEEASNMRMIDRYETLLVAASARD